MATYGGGVRVSNNIILTGAIGPTLSQTVYTVPDNSYVILSNCGTTTTGGAAMFLGTSVNLTQIDLSQQTVSLTYLGPGTTVTVNSGSAVTNYIVQGVEFING